MTLRATAALALLAPAVALAAQPPAVKPGPRSAPPATRPQARPPAAADEAPAPEIGGLVGYERSDFSGPALRVDGELPVRPLTPRVRLSLLGSVGYARLTWRPGNGVKGTADVLELVPALRFRLPVAPRLTVFGDAGLGVARVSAKVSLPASFGAPDVSGSSVNVLLRLGVGAWYRATERVALGALIEVDPCFGDFGFKSAGPVSAGSQTLLLALVGAQVRL